MEKLPITSNEAVAEAHRIVLNALAVLPADEMTMGDIRVGAETLPLAWLQDTDAAFRDFPATEPGFPDLEPSGPPDLRKDFEKARNDLVNRVIAIHCLNVQDAVGDTEGFLEGGHWEPAGVTARRALRQAAAAFLAHRGDLYLADKWVWQRWRRTVGQAWGVSLADLIADGGLQSASAADITQLLWLAQSLVLSAISPLERPPVLRHRAQTLTRDPYAAAVPSARSVLIYRSRKTTTRVSPQGAYLLSAAHGRTRTEAVEATVNGLGQAGYLPTADSVERYLDALIAAGLITDPTT